MTTEEIKQLRKGDIIYVPHVVDEVMTRSVYAHLMSEEETEERLHLFAAFEIKSWERPRRKFRKGDIVVTTAGCFASVTQDESEKGVTLNFLPEDDYRDASDLTLVMTAEEYAERMGKKGGDDA